MQPYTLATQLTLSLSRWCGGALSASHKLQDLNFHERISTPVWGVCRHSFRESGQGRSPGPYLIAASSREPIQAMAQFTENQKIQFISLQFISAGELEAEFGASILLIDCSKKKKKDLLFSLLDLKSIYPDYRSCLAKSAAC